jgi:acyl-CoA thioesterase-1
MKTIVFVGDSITEGAGDSEKGGWSRRVAETLPAEWQAVHAGISGNTIVDILARLERDVLAHKPDLVTLAVGINDSRHHPSLGGLKEVPLPDYEAGLQRFAERVAAEKIAKIIIIGLTPIDDSQTGPIEEDLVYTNEASLAYDKALRGFAKKRGYQYIAITPLFDAQGGAVELTTDGLHPNPAGHEIIAGAVRAALEESF